METDNQHLDFLISQYVDGCLEGSNKKLVEQKMLTDPAARKLYAEHRETQDVLDDWGSRIPLINWDDFDKKLAGRLEAEAVENERVSLFRRRMKPWAVAAALLLAVGLGYMWHAMSQGPAAVGGGTPGAVAVNGPRTKVEHADLQRANVARSARMEIVESGAAGQAVAKGTAAEVSAPPEATAYKSLMDSVEYGLGNLPENVQGRAAPQGAVAVDVLVRKEETPR